MVVHAMHDLLWQYQFRFLATVCLSLFSSKQCIIKQLLDLVLVISWIIKVLVSIIILGLRPRPWLFQISQKHHPIIMFIIMSIILILVVIVSCNFQIICNVKYTFFISLLFQGIYEFLAFYLPCTKETLLKRAKNLLLNDQVSWRAGIIAFGLSPISCFSWKLFKFSYFIL